MSGGYLLYLLKLHVLAALELTLPCLLHSGWHVLHAHLAGGARGLEPAPCAAHWVEAARLLSFVHLLAHEAAEQRP